MPRAILRLTLTSLLLLFARGAGAGTAIVDPWPANATYPRCVTLVGSSGGVPARAFGEFEVVVRDLAMNPMPGIPVWIDLAGVSDVRLCDDQLDPGLVVDCPTQRVIATTDLAGRAVITLLGGGKPGGARTLAQAGAVYAIGVLLGYCSVSTFDADGAGGVGANDLSEWLADFGSGQPYARSDYDCDGGIGVNDLSLWLSALGAGTQTASCAASCP